MGTEPAPLAALAVQYWKLCAAFERELGFASEERAVAGEAQLRFARRRLEAILGEAGLKLAVWDGAAFTPDLPASPVNAEDIADVVAAALTDPRHANRLYEVTGPKALTFAEAVETIAQVVGRPIRYKQISADAFAADMRRAGVPGHIVALLKDLFTVVLDGRNCQVAHGVGEVLDRPARDFGDYARAAAAAGSWRI